MPAVATDAIVLHMFNYLETSRILRVATREFGVQSVLARGARRSKGRFGTALDLFAEGTAQIEWRPGRELQTLTGFDVAKAHGRLAADLGRFTAAAALSECVQRVVTEDHAPVAYDITQAAIGALEQAPPDAVVGVTLAALWRLVGELGFAPVLEQCAHCFAAVPDVGPLAFSHSAGGLLCERCGATVGGRRRLPQSERERLQGWLEQPLAALIAEPAAHQLTALAGRAHQRLLREFMAEHLRDARELRAWAVWEADAWSGSSGK